MRTPFAPRATCWAALVLASAAAAVAACSGNGGNDGGGPTSCTVAVSGAVTLSGRCTTGDTAVYADNPGATATSLSLSTPDSSIVAVVGVLFTGQPVVGKSYRDTDTPPSLTNISVTRNDGAVWSVVTGTDAPMGSYVLTLTSAHETGSSNGLVYYVLHGSITATLGPTAGAATGAVMVTATF